MKLTKAQCRVTGVHLGELALNLLPQNQKEGGHPPILAKLALVRDDGSFCGSYTKVEGFSQKTVDALRTFVDSLEDDVLNNVFVIAETDKDETAAVAATPPPAEEPPQF